MTNYPIVKMSCVANLFSRMMHFQKKGDKEGGHSHVFNHLTLLAKGSLEVTVDGQATVFSAPHMIYIRKDKLHELVALEDDTLAFCIHALRDGEGTADILDPDNIPKGIGMAEILRSIAR
jgi:quercetin dioxygenase-like cupin family protein